MAVNRIPKDIEVGLDKDPKKAEALLTHKYVLKVKANNGLEEADKIYVICKYLEVSEMETLYSDVERTGNMVGYVELFRKCVKEIHNLLHPTEDREVTVEEILHSRYSSFIYSIIVDVGSHILKSAKLNEAERKN